MGFSTCPSILKAQKSLEDEVKVISYPDLPRSGRNPVQARMRSEYEIKVEVAHTFCSMNVYWLLLFPPPDGIIAQGHPRALCLPVHIYNVHAWMKRVLPMKTLKKQRTTLLETTDLRVESPAHPTTYLLTTARPPLQITKGHFMQVGERGSLKSRYISKAATVFSILSKLIYLVIFCIFTRSPC